MKKLLILCFWGLGIMFSGTSDSNELKSVVMSEWLSIDDRVMGGISQSKMQVSKDSWVFSGELSLENNGGFASVRSLIDLGATEQEAFVRLKVKGDGKYYQLRFRTNRYMDGVAYSAGFQTKQGEVTYVELSLDDFAAVWRGRPVPRAAKLQWQDVSQIGFMISNKQEGDFALEVQSVTWLIKA